MHAADGRLTLSKFGSAKTWNGWPRWPRWVQVTFLKSATVAQYIECLPPKENVVGSSPIGRGTLKKRVFGLLVRDKLTEMFGRQFKQLEPVVRLSGPASYRCSGLELTSAILNAHGQKITMSIGLTNISKKPILWDDARATPPQGHNCNSSVSGVADPTNEDLSVQNISLRFRLHCVQIGRSVDRFPACRIYIMQPAMQEPTVPIQPESDRFTETWLLVKW